MVSSAVNKLIRFTGALNLNLKGCTGNQNLKDVILGLKWIKENIRVFGGDPENITLLGSSSGSAIIHMLLLSPLSKGKIPIINSASFNKQIKCPVEVHQNPK